MGWNGLKIDGHSGTQFKHRKGFERRKRWVQEKMRTQGKVREGGYAPRERARGYPSWVYYSLLVAAGLIVLFFAGQFLGETVETVDKYHAGIVRGMQEQRTSNYNQLLELAEGSLAGGYWDDAIDDFGRLKETFPENWAVNIGLAKALAGKCAAEGESCSLAREQLMHCYGLPAKEGDVLQQLEDQLKQY
ncbi:MAG: hypothetical protein ACRBG0_09440 [Lewinella sp.]|uniref:hypothetical protein n=1 Tax=Lewinella sp. TaxID=2004506 RepID=UPI003D6A969C